MISSMSTIRSSLFYKNKVDTFFWRGEVKGKLMSNTSQPGKNKNKIRENWNFHSKYNSFVCCNSKTNNRSNL